MATGNLLVGLNNEKNKGSPGGNKIDVAEPSRAEKIPRNPENPNNPENPPRIPENPKKSKNIQRNP